ncbi:MAG: MBG domain-containing protein, partial [Candidatus Omnitrophota bacterium]
GSVTLTSAGAAATADVAGSPYAITPSTATGGTFDPANYSITYYDGALTVNQAPLSITASDNSKVYGDVLTFLGTEFITSGLKNADDVTGVTLTSSGAVGTTGVGSYDIVPSNAVGSGLGNYDITYHNGTLSVTPRTLDITANDASKTYGDLLTFAGTEFASSGLQNGETIGSVTLNSSGAAATANVAGSPYAITPSAATGGSFDPANYDITYHDGALTINRSTGLTITADDATKTGGDVLTFAGTEFTVTGLLNSDAVDSATMTSAGAVAGAAAGDYGIVPSNAVGTGLDNYDINYVNGTLTVNAAPVPLELFAQYEQLRYKLPYLEQLQPKQINPLDLISSTDWTGPVYFYHPLTETNMAAFDQFTLEEGAYQFIEGNINIIGHANIPPMLEEIKKRGVVPLP